MRASVGVEARTINNPQAGAKPARKVFPVLTLQQQLALGTGPYALMPCKACGQLGCLIPVSH